MAEAAAKLPEKQEKKPPERASALEPWQPFGSLRREIDRLFEDFDRGFWRFPFRRSAFDIEPFWRREWAAAPPVDIIEKDNAYEVTADLPGLDEKDIEVKLVKDSLSIKGEKQEEKEEKKKDYYMCVSAISARLSAPSGSRKASTPTKSPPPSKRVFSR